MAWIYLITAGILEVIWSVAMKQSKGLTRLLPTAITIVASIGSFGLLALAMRSLPLGTSYTIWTGMGAVGTFAIGVIALGEQASVVRLVAAGLIISGLVIMKLGTPS